MNLNSVPPPSRLAGHFPISRTGLAPLTDVFFTPPPKQIPVTFSSLSLRRGPGAIYLSYLLVQWQKHKPGEHRGATGTPPRASAGMVEGGVGTEWRTRSRSACSGRRRLRWSCCTSYQSCSGDSKSDGGGGRLLVCWFSGGG